MIAQMAFLSRIVSLVFLAHQDLAQVSSLLLLLVGTIVVHAGIVWVREVTALQGAIRVKSELRELLFARLLQLGPAYSRGERTGELVATLSEGIERLDAYVSRYVPQMALSLLVPLLIAGYILPLDWTSAVLLLVTGPVSRNMELALRKTFDATPEPRLVVAVGACGCSGGIFGQNYATTPGTGPAEQRLREQDQDGIDAENPADFVSRCVWSRHF
jgi:ABC-type multidrug transport system fused ATPase/permease subunit